MYATNYFENKVCNLCRGQSFAAPTKVYVGLFLTNPGDDGQGTEITYTGYERKEVVFSEPTTSGGGLVLSNSASISFAECDTTAGNVTHLGILDAKNGGNMLLYGQLDTPLSVQSGVTPIIRENSIKWVFSGRLSTYYRTAIMNVLRGETVTGFTPYIAFYGSDPNAGGDEFSGNNYARFAVTFGVPEQQSSGAARIANTAECSSPISTGNWGNLTYVAVMDNETGGNVFCSNSIGTTYAMTSGKSAGFREGDLSFSIN